MSEAFRALPRPTKTYHTTAYPAISPSRPELSLKGRTALITGGATGIGLESSLAFAQAGVSTLIILARRQSTLDEASTLITDKYPSTQVHTLAISITDHLAINAAIASLPPIDILVLSAAYLASPAPVLSTPISDLTTSLETNVIGPLNLIQSVLSHPLSSPDAQRTIMYVTSASVQMPVPGVGAYTASKIAMTSLMATIQNENPGVRAFAFHPAFAFTPLARDVLGMKEEEGTYDSVTLPAHYAVWLASAEADFLKGKYTWAHWDVEELMAKREVIASDANQLTLSLVQDKVVEG